MVLILKKGASKLEIKKIEKQLNTLKSKDISKYCGKIKLKKDPLQIQKELRDEWE
jgi:hypothetical protein